MAKISTRKRGKKNPTWYYSFDAGTMPDGKRKRVEKGGFATEKAARIAGTKEMASFLKGNVAIVSEKILVRDFFDEWLERKKMEVRANTLKNYRSALARMEPIIGDKYMQKLRPKDIDDMIRQLAGKGLSYGTLSVTLTYLKDVFRFAVYPAEIIQSNPAQYIKVPRNAPKGIIRRTIIREGKLDELLNAFPFGTQPHIPILLAYHTGMRIGETLGLTWPCVDLARGVIRVERQLTYTSDTGHRFGPPKTQTSIREIPIGEQLVSLLKRWKAQQAANEVKYGRAYIYIYEAKDGCLWQMQKQAKPERGMVRRALVCTQPNGKAASRSSVTCALKSHGLNHHSLRHTHATLCAENGAPAKGLAGRLGHKNICITENLYTHETELMQEDTLEAFEKSIKKRVL